MEGYFNVLCVQGQQDFRPAIRIERIAACIGQRFGVTFETRNRNSKEVGADYKRLYFVERFSALLQKEDFERLVVALHKYGRRHAPVGSQTLDKLLVLNVYKKSHTRSGLVKLLVEKAFCLDTGNAVHIDVAGAQKRQVAVSHIQLKARQIGVVFCVKACVCVAQNVLNPSPAKARIIADFAPAALPVCRADFFFF